MPGLLDTFKQKATEVKDYLYPPAPNGMNWMEYAQFKANDPLQPNLSSRITQQDLVNKGLLAVGMAPMGMMNTKPKSIIYNGWKIIRRDQPTSTAKSSVNYFVPSTKQEYQKLKDAQKAIDEAIATDNAKYGL